MDMIKLLEILISSKKHKYLIINTIVFIHKNNCICSEDILFN